MPIKKRTPPPPVSKFVEAHSELNDAVEDFMEACANILGTRELDIVCTIQQRGTDESYSVSNFQNTPDLIKLLQSIADHNGDFVKV